jgi:hypothetical protein
LQKSFAQKECFLLLDNEKEIKNETGFFGGGSSLCCGTLAQKNDLIKQQKLWVCCT